jgi:glycosyltransferase involved in cell wall biosynthesis
VQAKTKIGWLHFDSKMFPPDPKITKWAHGNYKKIFAVSETAKKNYLELFPEFADKTEVFYNITNPVYVRQLANKEEGFNDELNPSTKRILTVGRLSREKGQDLALDAAHLLIKAGVDFQWYFIGEGGGFEEYLKQKTQQLGLSSHVCFLGKKTNPYPYLKECDLYVQPSKHEGFCISLAEAICFEAPIVATDFCGAREQLTSRPNGFIAEHSPESLAEKCIEALKASKISLEQNCQVKTATQTRIQQLIEL